MAGSIFTWPQAAHGQQYEDIGNEPPFALSQLFTLPSAGTYSLTWSDNTALNIAPGFERAPYSVSLVDTASNEIFSIIFDSFHSDGAWQKREVMRALAAGDYTLIFTSRNGFNQTDTLIDDVAVTEATAVPEPASALLIAAAVCDLMLSRRNRVSRLNARPGVRRDAAKSAVPLNFIVGRRTGGAMSLVYSIARRFVLLFLVPIVSETNAQSIDYPSAIEFEGEASGPVYKISFKQALTAKNGNWVEEQDQCKMPHNLAVEGSIIFTLHMDHRSTEAAMKILGQSTAAGVPHIQTDAGIDIPLGKHCLLDLRRNAPAKLSSTQARGEAEDALARPSAKKLYRLAQLLTRQ